MNTTDPDRAWIVSWAAPAGVAIPATSAHRTLAGARRRIRAELLAAGDPAALAVEETVRGVVTGDTGRLAWNHRDPFDRMIVAQAARRGLTIATRDADILGAALTSTLKV